MNSLLKRQIRKYLPKDILESGRLEEFLDAINRSYENSDDQFLMLQRATTISSEELSEASDKLKEETKEQRKLIEKLKSVLNTLKAYELEEGTITESSNTLSLLDFIDNQTKEIVKINKQKDKLLYNLERQNQELNDYTHMISHDLVSPLQSIETLTQWLIDDHKEYLNEEGKNHIELIRDHVEKIDTLVASIRKYSRIIRTVKTYSDFDLNDVILTIQRELRLPENVKIYIPRSLPTLNGDKYCCKELFINLIDNAVKFNDKKDQQIKVGYEESDSYWKFYVKDNGKGIDSAYLEKVFVAFAKLENDYKSAGMGLAIVKKIIDVYQGKVWIESELNKGTTVYFTIKK